MVGESLGCQNKPEVEVTDHDPLYTEGCLDGLSAKQGSVSRISLSPDCKADCFLLGMGYVGSVPSDTPCYKFHGGDGKRACFSHESGMFSSH